MRRIIILSLIMVLLSGCAIPLRVDVTMPKSEKLSQEETETEKIADLFEGEKFLLWEAFQKIEIGEEWKDNFKIASYINHFYDTTEDPTKEKFYEYLREQLTGYSKMEIIKPAITREPKNWFQRWLWKARPHLRYVEYSVTKYTQKSGLRDDIVDGIIYEMQNYYKLKEQTESVNEE